MLPPLTKEEQQRLLPAWALKLMKECIPLVPGLAVYDVLYGGRHHAAKGIVKLATHHEDGYDGVAVDFIDGKGSSGGSALHWVPDITDSATAEYVAAWRRGEAPAFILRCSCGTTGESFHTCPFVTRVFEAGEIQERRCLCCKSCETGCDKEATWVLDIREKHKERRKNRGD